MTLTRKFALFVILCIPSLMNAQADDIFNKVEHGYADSNGVKIHYASIGDGPLLIMIHGFPDFWYSWRYQMEALAKNYKVVAIDQRGYNKSDKPKGQENYDIKFLIGDVKAVQEHFGVEKSIIVGHDWGGVVSWAFTSAFPERVEKLIICNLPHPRGLSRELAHSNEQKKNSAYARRFQQADAHKALSAELLAAIHGDKDPLVQARYVEAFKNSDIEAMLHYYKQNYNSPPYMEDTSPIVKIKPPVLMIHGLNDTALLPGALNDTWEWLEKDLTLVTVPGAGHWVQEDAPVFVSNMMSAWLTIQKTR
ncbi:epoxide hydrolase EphM [Aurantivibrio infirmus]